MTFPALLRIATAMTEPIETAARWSIAIHGGAGSMTRETMPKAAQAEHLAALETARDAGSAILAEIGRAHV